MATANSQFAKEAMAHQSLDHNEILNVRWATVDPNPQAQKREAHRIEEQAAEAIRRALPAAYVAEIEGRDPEAKKRRKVEGSFGLEGYEAPDNVWHEKEKAEWDMAKEVQKVGGTGFGERKMIEEMADDGEEEYSGLLLPQKQDESANGGGILSSQTLQALRGYTAVSAGAKRKVEDEAPKGPLVAYGSDSDED